MIYTINLAIFMYPLMKWKQKNSKKLRDKNDENDEYVNIGYTLII